MSGIYINRMVMPDSCYDCPVECEGDMCEITKYRCSWDVRPPHCPLVPVPQHGRLIDADELLQKHERIVDSWGKAHIVSAQAIRNAPTIIEAEEGE